MTNYYILHIPSGLPVTIKVSYWDSDSLNRRTRECMLTTTLEDIFDRSDFLRNILSTYPYKTKFNEFLFIEMP